MHEPSSRNGIYFSSWHSVQQGDDSVWGLMIVFCIYFSYKVFSSIVLQVKAQFGWLESLCAFWKSTACFWLLKTVRNVSTDFHSHAFQLSPVLPLFFQNIMARFQKTVLKIARGLIAGTCEEPQDTCGQHMRTWWDGSVKSGRIKWPGGFDLLWNFYGFILTVQAAWDCFSKQE